MKVKTEIVSLSTEMLMLSFVWARLMSVEDTKNLTGVIQLCIISISASKRKIRNEQKAGAA
jgi:hypothetical protein